jgi:hypothetical protein
MSVSPISPRALTSNDAWAIDLFPSQRPATPTPAPTPSTATPRTTNVAKINGQNIRYSGASHHWDVDIPYLQADLLDLTPENPLSIWEFGTYKIKVNAGQVKVSQDQANKLIASQLWDQGPNFPVKNASVEFRKNNDVKVKGVYHWGILPIPLSVTANLATPTNTTVLATPKSVRVFGVPVLWAAKLFNIDVAKYLPASGPATMNPDKSVTVDLTKTDIFEGTISKIAITNGQAVVTMGGAPGPGIAPSRTKGNPNYAEVVAQGEVALDSAIIRNATVVIQDNTPQDPYSLNLWDEEGFAHVESGDVILDEGRLAKKFANAGEGFALKSAKLEGANLVVEGTYETFGLPVPIDFKLNFTRTADGRLKLTPKDVEVFSFIGYGHDQLMDAMAKVPGLTRDGDGYILDLRASASVEMPNIRNIKTEPGRIVLQP